MLFEHRGALTAGEGARSPSDYPPAPWRLAGHVVVLVAPVALDVARSRVPAPLRLAPVLPGYALAAVLLGLYGAGSTLRYGELATAIGPLLGAGAPAAFVDAMYVDDVRSRAGGRELWGVPKELARFRWRPGVVEVSDAMGAPLLRAEWREPRVHVPLPAAVGFIGALDGVVRRGRLAGMLRLAPARVELELSPHSPLAALPIDGRRLGAVGRLDMRARVTRPSP